MGGCNVGKRHVRMSVTATGFRTTLCPPWVVCCPVTREYLGGFATDCFPNSNIAKRTVDGIALTQRRQAYSRTCA